MTNEWYEAGVPLEPKQRKIRRKPRSQAKNTLLDLDTRQQVAELPKQQRRAEASQRREYRDLKRGDKRIFGRAARKVEKAESRAELAEREANAIEQGAARMLPLRERNAIARRALTPVSLKCPCCGRGPLLKTRQWVVRTHRVSVKHGGYAVCRKCWFGAKTPDQKRELALRATVALKAERHSRAKKLETAIVLMPHDKPRSPYDGRKPGPGRKRVHPDKSINEGRKARYRSKVDRGIILDDRVETTRLLKSVRDRAPEAVDFVPIELGRRTSIDRLFGLRL